MRTALRDHQLADLGKDLLRSNRFLSADLFNTSRTIFDPDSIPQEIFDQLSNDSDSKDHFLPQMESDPSQEETLDKPHNNDLSTGEYQHRRTRSGRVTCPLASEHPCAQCNRILQQVPSVLTQSPVQCTTTRLNRTKPTVVHFTWYNKESFFLCFKHTQNILTSLL